MRSFIYIFCILSLSACSQEVDTNYTAPDNQVELVQDEMAQESLDSTYLTYSWLENYNVANTLVNRIPVPTGYTRVETDSASFANWLRHIPLKEGKPDVLLYDGSHKWNQDAHHLVINMDVDAVDLQQCADAIMRLKGEFHFQEGNFSAIHFNYTSGDEIGFEKYSQGYKPTVGDNGVYWRSCSSCNSSYDSFRDYMINIFSYAGTLSMSRELEDIELNEMQIGDMFVYGGSPGHMMIVVDMAINEQGEKLFILGQSFMPAQEMHIVVNPINDELSPWYAINEIEDRLRTPEWSFSPDALMRFSKR